MASARPWLTDAIERLGSAPDQRPLARDDAQLKVGGEDEIAEAALFPASERSSSVRGAMLTADGGRLLLPSYAIQANQGMECNDRQF